MSNHTVSEYPALNLYLNPPIKQDTSAIHKIDHSQKVVFSISQLYRNENYSDVNLVVQGVRFPAHKVILASRSDYFRALFYGGMAESSCTTVQLNDVNAVAFRRVLRYIYSGRLRLRSTKLTLSILGLAHQYNFRDLEQAISAYLTHSLQLKNVWLVYDLAIMYGLEPLVNACLKFFDSIAPAPLYDPRFLHLSQSAVERLLSRSSFCAPEIEIFRMVSKWLQFTEETELKQYNSQTTNELSNKTNDLPTITDSSSYTPTTSARNSLYGDTDSSSIRNYLERRRTVMMRHCVRFELMSLSDLLTTVRSSKLVGADDLLDAINRLTNCPNELPHRGWLMAGVNLASVRLGCTLISGEAGTYPYFFVDDPVEVNKIERTPQKKANCTGDAEDKVSAEPNENDDMVNTDTNDDDEDDNSGSLEGQTLSPGLKPIELRDVTLPMHDSYTEETRVDTNWSTQTSLRNTPINSNSVLMMLPRQTNTLQDNFSGPSPNDHTRSMRVTMMLNPNMASDLTWNHSRRFFQLTSPSTINATKSQTSLLITAPHSEFDIVHHSLDDSDACITIRLGKASILNTIRMQLWDRDLRSYSYYIDVSLDQVNWDRVVDYSNYLCRSWQTIHFPARVLRYIRITGRRNTFNRIFHLITFRCLFSETIFKQVNGFLVPNENVATVEHGATVLEGVSRNRNALIDGNVRLYDWNSGYTCHQLGNGAIVVQLAQPFLIRSMRFLLWDLDRRSYSYAVYVSNDRVDWTLVRDATREQCRSWQIITFPLQLITFIRVVGTHNTANEVFHLVHLECPYPPAEAEADSELIVKDPNTSDIVADTGALLMPLDIHSTQPNETNEWQHSFQSNPTEGRDSPEVPPSQNLTSYALDLSHLSLTQSHTSDDNNTI